MEIPYPDAVPLETSISTKSKDSPGNHDENYRYTIKNNNETADSQKEKQKKKELGVLVDNNLLFRNHNSKKKVAIANRNLGFIFKTCEFMAKTKFHNLYLH